MSLLVLAERHPVDAAAATMLMRNVRNISIGPTTSRADIIGQMTEALRTGGSLRMGLHGLEIQDCTARFFLATEGPGCDRSYQRFQDDARLVATVSALHNGAEIDYSGLAARFHKAWVGNLQHLPEDGNNPRFGL